MTDKNTHRFKGRATFLAAIMVVSMIAVGFAAAPAAAVTEVSDVDADVVFDGDTAGNVSGLVWQGQTVGLYNIEPGTEIQLRERIDGTTTRFRTSETANSSGIVIFGTENRGEGDYFFRSSDTNAHEFSEGDNNRDSTQFEIVVQDLTGEFDDDEVGNQGADADTEIEFDSDRSSYTIEVDADGDLDEDELAPIFDDSFDVNKNTGDEDTIELMNVNDGNYMITFHGVDDGDYEFTFDVVDTTAEATDSISVSETADGEIDLVTSTIAEQVGETVQITVEPVGAADSGLVVIGDEGESGYYAAVEITTFGDADEATLNFNTYTAGSDGHDIEDVIWLDEDSADDDVELGSMNQTSSIDGLLDAGDYDISVSSQYSDANEDVDDVIDNPQNVGSLTLDDRFTDGLTTWTASDGTVSDIDDLGDLEERVGESVTESGEIAYDDYVFHQIEASGVSGLMDSTGHELDAEEQFINLLENEQGPNSVSSLDVRIRQTSASAGPNVNRQRIDLNNENVVVFVDSAGNNLYFGVDTSDFENTMDLSDGLDEEADYEFEIRFRVQDERLLGFDDDEVDDITDLYEILVSTYEVNERTASFDLDPYNATASGEVTFSGETNIAPGSEMNVRIRSTGDTRPSFIENGDTTVGADGTWTSEEFDLSETSTGDTFRVSLRQANFPSTPTVDGTIVDAVDEGTPTPTEEETETPTPTEEPDTPTPTEETEEPDTPETEEPEDTDDDTPGFGAIVALVALLAAALLATRRRP